MTSGQAAIDAERIIGAALAARDAGRAADALTPLRRAIRTHPRNPRLWQTLAVIHRALDDSAAAANAFAEAARLSPADLKAAHGLALSSLEAGLPAFALFERARALAPADGSLLLGSAAAQIAQGQPDAAIAMLDAVVEANPGWLEGQAALARMRWTHGQSARLFDGYRRALAVQPRQAALWADLLDLLVRLEHYDQIDGVLARARAALDDPAAFPVFEAVAASEMRDDARAERLFTAQATLQQPELVVRHMRHLLRTGRPEDAAARGEPLLAGPAATQVWPYMTLAWRLVGDPRHDWLEMQPGLVGIHDLAEPLAALTGLVPLLRRLHNSVAHPIGQSVRGGTQTDGALLRRAEPEIVALRALLQRKIAQHIADWPHDPAHPTFGRRPPSIGFAGSWSVRLTGAGGGHHSNHIHPQGWISSALYLALPGEADLGPPPAGWLALGVPPAELGLDLAPLRQIEPRFGRLVLFPSTMWHGTNSFGAGERLTVAFDVAG